MVLLKTLLSKRVLVSVIFGIVIVSFSLWNIQATKNKNDISKTQEDEASLERQRDEKIAELDSDGDGLKDWEELLVGTNPKNPDTDGDGVSDFNEVNNPENKNGTKTEDLGKKSVTEEAVGKIFGAYIRSKLTDTYNPASLAKVVGGVTAETFNKFSTTDKYEEGDIKAVLDTPSDKTAKQYYKTANSATGPLRSIKEYELTTYALAIESSGKDREKYLAKLSFASDVYESAARNLLVVPVPKDALEKHIELVNSLENFSSILKNMSEDEGDPIMQYALIRNFLDNEERLNEAYRSLGLYFKKYDIN